MFFSVFNNVTLNAPNEGAVVKKQTVGSNYGLLGWQLVTMMAWLYFF